MKPQTAKNLPQTLENGKDDDYLGLGSFGGSSDHFTQQGPDIYGFNWWFNDTGRLNPDTLTWPDAPADTVMSLGAGGNCSAFIPRLNVAVIAAPDWGSCKAGDPETKQNQVLKLLTEATTGHGGKRGRAGGGPAKISGALQKWQPVIVDFAGPQANASDSEPNPFWIIASR